MEFSNLFDPEWWNSPGGKAPVTSAREEIDAATAGYRSPTGSLDPANITPEYLKKYGISPDAERDIKEIVGLGRMRADAMKGMYDVPERTPLQFLGHALSAASVPVAYAQGNRGYANAMVGNTLADQHNQKIERMKSLDREEQRGIVADTFGSVDKTAQAIQAARRERQKTALSGAQILHRNGQTQEAIELLKMNGMGEYAAAYEQELTKRAGATPSAPGGPTTPGGPVSSPMPGVSVTPPQAGPPAGVPGQGGGMPPQGASPAPAAPGGPGAFAAPGMAPSVEAYQPSPQAKKLLDNAAYARALGRDDLAKQMEDQAKLMDEPRSEAAKAQATELGKGLAERQNKLTKSQEQAPKVAALLDSLGKYSETPGFDLYTGPLDASRFAPYTTDVIAGFIPGNESNPAIRDQITGTQMALVALLKDSIRTPGEGSQDQREFQAVIDTVGDMTNARNATEYQQKLNDTLARIEAFTGTKIPVSHKTFAKQSDAAVDAGTPPAPNAPARVSAAQEPEGATRTIKDESGNLVKVQRINGQWVEMGPAQTSVPTPGPQSQFRPRGNPTAGG